MWWNDYIDIPFIAKGRSRSGCDCWGLVYLVYKNIYNIILPTYTNTYDDPHATSIVSHAIRGNMSRWHYIRKDLIQEGNLVLFNIYKIPCHIGIYTHDGFMLHTSKGVGTTIEKISRSCWAHRIEGYYRYE